MTQALATLASIALLAVGCEDLPDPPERRDPDTGQPPDEDWLDQVRDATRPLSERINAARTGIAADPCVRDPSADCEMGTYTAGPPHLGPGTDDERVLVIDVLSPSVDMLRYRHRVVGVHNATVDGTIVEQPVAFDVPRTFGDVVTAFAQFPPVAASDLTPLRDVLDAAYGDRVPTFGSHGLLVHWILVDRVPERPVVFLDFRDWAFHRALPDVVCAIREPGDARVDELREHATKNAEALATFYEEHHIAFVNASFGFTRADVVDPWVSTCGESPPAAEVTLEILDAYTPLFEVLLGTPGVFVAHAALQSPRPDDGPFDVPSPVLDRRIRVGSLTHRGQAIPAGGSSAAPAAGRQAPENPFWADVYVNSGCDFEGCRSPDGLSIVGPFGMGVTPLDLTQSSFVTPLVVAEAVARRDRAPERPWDDAHIDDVIDALRGTCGVDTCFRDPLLHGGLPRP